MSEIQYHEMTRQLQARVAKLERTVEFLLTRLELEYVDELPSGVDPEVFKLLQAGKKIEAIKLYRDKTGADLKTAMQFIESL
jgi:ribosomal protein L7/L12